MLKLNTETNLWNNQALKFGEIDQTKKLKDNIVKKIGKFFTIKGAEHMSSEDEELISKLEDTFPESVAHERNIEFWKKHIWFELKNWKMLKIDKDFFKSLWRWQHAMETTKNVSDNKI
jgi:hypothetical protein